MVSVQKGGEQLNGDVWVAKNMSTDFSIGKKNGFNMWSGLA